MLTNKVLKVVPSNLCRISRHTVNIIRIKSFGIDLFDLTSLLIYLAGLNRLDIRVISFLIMTSKCLGITARRNRRNAGIIDVIPILSAHLSFDNIGLRSQKLTPSLLINAKRTTNTSRNLSLTRHPLSNKASVIRVKGIIDFRENSAANIGIAIDHEQKVIPTSHVNDLTDNRLRDHRKFRRKQAKNDPGQTTLTKALADITSIQK